MLDFSDCKQTGISMLTSAADMVQVLINRLAVSELRLSPVVSQAAKGWNLHKSKFYRHYSPQNAAGP